MNKPLICSFARALIGMFIDSAAFETQVILDWDKIVVVLTSSYDVRDSSIKLVLEGAVVGQHD